jgi:hypothetical protein
MKTSRELDAFCVEPVLDGLHGFQRDAVEHAFNRLFVAPDSTRRFLVADEVGLGKTLIAKGVVAKAIEHLRGRVGRIDIVYICSNLGIARQNLNRLNPLPHRDLPNAERITLLPIHLKDLHDGDINLISFTPGTSLEVKDSLGTSRERLLLYLLLEQIWSFRGVGPLNVLQGNIGNPDTFREAARRFRDEHQESLAASASLVAGFARELERAHNIRGRFDDLCKRFARTRKHLPEEDRQDRNRLVGELRAILARTCVSALEPDLIILDEFQRFKELLDPNSESGELAKQLFEWSSAHARAHVLLLSATPYKPYTLQHESAEDDHYSDFLRTVDFLQNGSGVGGNIQAQIRDYRRELIRATPEQPEALIRIKADIERSLTRVMSRTERLAVAGEQNGMLKSLVRENIPLRPEDMRAYVDSRTLSHVLEAEDPLEYWKAAAYPVNFMDGYQLKHKLQALVDSGKANDDALGSVRGATSGLLTKAKAEQSEALAVPNAKLRELIADLDSLGAFDILWLPPSMPAHELRGSFESARTKGITKRLIFSAWNLVPRSIATLVSHEAERRAYLADRDGPDEDVWSRQDRGGLLRIYRDDGHPAGMPVLALMYPSRALAELCDPAEYLRSHGLSRSSWDELFAWAIERVGRALPTGIECATQGEAANEAWYWAAPLLMDREKSLRDTRDWWEQSDLAELWQGADEADEADEDGEGRRATRDVWQSHVEAARVVIAAGEIPSGKAPADMVEVLALLGLAGPAVSALRALTCIYREANDQLAVRNAAARCGWSFRGVFNRPQSMAVVRAGRRDRPYWRQVLDYSAQGGLSSVIQEYVHVLRDATGAGMQPPEKALATLTDAMEEALGVRAATLSVDELAVDEASQRVAVSGFGMRSLFAMRFGSDKREDTKQVRRDGATRGAFNSPFWPFVLASTSVGQEGLDFHWYCHAIVHWNLPSNPVDLEQREGRIHRFKGHAIRKNVALKWGADALRMPGTDPWKAAFDLARSQTKPEDKGLVPYWLYPLPDGAWIERHVLLYPLSRDQQRYEALKKSLGAYRLVFGQPRQDELLAYLLDKVEPEQLKALESLLRIDLSPPRRASVET